MGDFDRSLVLQSGSLDVLGRLMGLSTPSRADMHRERPSRDLARNGALGKLQDGVGEATEGLLEVCRAACSFVAGVLFCFILFYLTCYFCAANSPTVYFLKKQKCMCFQLSRLLVPRVFTVVVASMLR